MWLLGYQVHPWVEGRGARVVERKERRAGVQRHQRHIAQALRHGVVAHVDEVAQDDIRLERLRAAAACLTHALTLQRTACFMVQVRTDKLMDTFMFQV